jgi:predicted metal-dependent hydrolase
MFKTDFILNIKRDARSKRISIRINKKSECFLTIPKRLSLSNQANISQIQKFLDSHAIWIKEKISDIDKKRAVTNRALGLDKDLSGFTKVEHLDLKRRTENIVRERLDFFNQLYGFRYKDIKVKRLTSRWGSCSRRGNLNFAHTLCLLKPVELDYVVVHELCHLREFNHSKRFWDLVVMAIPDYKDIRKSMRDRVF